MQRLTKNNVARKSLATLALISLVLLGAPVSSRSQQKTLSDSFTESQAGNKLVGISGLRITFSRVSWYYPFGSPTTCLFRVEQSIDNITWNALVPLQDCSSQGKFEFITSFLSGLVRFNVTELTGANPTTGEGILNLFWEGLKGEGCGVNYRGIFSAVVSSDPTAGAEVLISVPSSERWRVYSASFSLQANSTVEDREVFLSASENGNEYFRTFADGVVKADQEGIFTASPLGFVGTAGLGPSSINQPTDVRTIMIPIYSEAFIPGGHTLSTSTNGLQSSDDYSSAVILVERCPN